MVGCMLITLSHLRYRLYFWQELSSQGLEMEVSGARNNSLAVDYLGFIASITN